MAREGFKRKLAAILSADAVGHSHLTGAMKRQLSV